MRRLPPLKTLQAFEAASRLGSVLKAADELCVTPSAVSHQIRLLEEQLGLNLFHRVHRSIVLTDAGKRYAEEIGDAFVRMEAATRHVAGTGKSDILSIHSVPSLATQWLMPRISRFSELKSDIDVRFHASPDPVDLVSGTMDIDIRYGSSVHESGLVLEPFPEETIVVLCAPQLMQGEHPIQTPEDLQHHTLIHSEANLFRWRDWALQFDNLKLELERGPRFDRSFMVINAAIDGRGVCMESRLLVQRELATGQLVMPLGADGKKIHCHSLAYLKSKAHLPKIRLFRNWLFEALEQVET